MTADLFFRFCLEKNTFLIEWTEKSPAIEPGFFYSVAATG
jgi:hypothetical protein